MPVKGGLPRLKRGGETLIATAPPGVAALDRALADGEELEMRTPGPGLLIGTGADDKVPGPWLMGTLDVLSAVELATVIIGARHTGVLEVHDPGGLRRLFFAEGQFAGSMSTHVEDRLGEVLWRLGRISLDQLMICKETSLQGKRIGRVLIELGYLDRNQLRMGLRQQARLVLEAACMETSGHVGFLSDVTHPNPVRIFASQDDMIDEILDRVDECRALEAGLQPLTAECRPVTPAPSGPLEEAETGVLQLATSAKGDPLSRLDVVMRSGLGKLAGLRALRNLIDAGHIESGDAPASNAAAASGPPRLERLCSAIDFVMVVLDDKGFGVGDTVREFLETPPEDVAEVLGGMKLDGPINPGTMTVQAQFLDDGIAGVERALEVLFDFAMFEARDALVDEDVDTIIQKVAELGL